MSLNLLCAQRGGEVIILHVQRKGCNYLSCQPNVSENSCPPVSNGCFQTLAGLHPLIGHVKVSNRKRLLKVVQNFHDVQNIHFLLKKKVDSHTLSIYFRKICYQS